MTEPGLISPVLQPLRRCKDIWVLQWTEGEFFTSIYFAHAPLGLCGSQKWIYYGCCCLRLLGTLALWVSQAYKWVTAPDSTESFVKLFNFGYELSAVKFKNN